MAAVGNRSVCGSDPGDGRWTRGRGGTCRATGAGWPAPAVVVLDAGVVGGGAVAGRDALCDVVAVWEPPQPSSEAQARSETANAVARGTPGL